MPEVLTVIAYVRAKKGQEAHVKQILEGLTAPTRAEAGCLNYDLFQSDSDPAEFVFYENWKSDADLDRHAQAPHIKASGALLTGLLAEPVKITKWRAVK
jgi:quinol monooxygenase YgiN